MERVDLSKIEFTPTLLASVGAATARLYQTVPVRQTPRQVLIAFAPMQVLEARDDATRTLQPELQFLLAKQIDFVIADRDQIREYVRRLYGEAEKRG